MVAHAPGAQVNGPAAGSERPRLPRPTGGLSRTRQLLGFALTLVGLPVMTALLVVVRDRVDLDSVLLLYLLAVVVVAVSGGLLPALLAAVESFLLANWFLTPPYYTFAVQGRDRVIELGVYVAVAVLVSFTVDLGARHRVRAERNQREAQMLSGLTRAEVGSVSAERILQQVRDLFGMSSVRLLEPGPDGRVLVSVGRPADEQPSLDVTITSGLHLVADGPRLFAEDGRLLHTLADAAARAWQEQELSEQAAQARQLAEVDKVRAGLLAAVGHDLRTPLAGIKASVSTLRQTDVEWSDEQRAELLMSIEESTDQLGALIGNLLAMSRLQAGALSVDLTAVALDEVVARALLSVGVGDQHLDVPDDLPPVLADAGLLERVVANLVSNARRHSPAEAPPEVTAVARGAATLVLRVADHGPGVPPDRWEEMFRPFQRLGDQDNRTGLGLGLAIARGFSEAMGATLTPSETPGGGLTMNLTVPVAR